MHWCLARDGVPVVQDRDEGTWIGTFKDIPTAQEIITKHNSGIIVNPPPQPLDGKWTNQITWK